MIDIEKQSIDNLLMIGDRVLIQPKTPVEKTKSGLYLPPGVQEKEKIYSGYIIKTGPGYPIPNIQEIDEPWKKGADEAKYLPLQAQIGDFAVFVKTGTFEVEINNIKYIVAPHSAIIMIFRDKGLLK